MDTPQPDQHFGLLLDYLKRHRGFDFAGYKPASLVRRIGKCMQQAHVGSYGDYILYLEEHPHEFAHLFNTILINVTSFFRDPLAWEYLMTEVLPRLASAGASDRPLRVWCAGVASGEEAYTVAMALCEVMGEGGYRERVRIYGTDVDEEALAQARLARFGAREMAALLPDYRDRYFEPAGDRFVFRNDLRRSIVFGRHDLLRDPPISHVDLLICRNTLMYFNSEAQGRIMARFHFALNDDGYLMLGKAEMLLTHGGLFEPLSLQRRVFVKSAKGHPSQWQLPPAS